MNKVLICTGVVVIVTWLSRLGIRWIKSAGQEKPERTNTHRLR